MLHSFPAALFYGISRLSLEYSQLGVAAALPESEIYMDI